MPLMEGGEGSEGAEGEEDEAPTDFVILPGPRADPAAWANATDVWGHRTYTYRLLSTQPIQSCQPACPKQHIPTALN